MGCCYSIPFRTSCNPLTTVDTKVALKLIHGLQYLDYDADSGAFIQKDNIHLWIHSCFVNKKMTNYINYNDEHLDKVSTTNGHCKGCVAWNDDELVWLIHSVPKFSLHFLGDGQLDTTKTRIAPSEQVYGQSFVFLSGIDVTELSGLLDQISIMHPFIDKSNSTVPLLYDHKHKNEHEVAHTALSSTIDHLAKPTSFEIDIFSDYLQPVYGGTWRCETWRRGHHCAVNPHVVDNDNIHFAEVSYTSSQDHSKYAVNDTGCVYIGDLNRMTSQYHRGGGGIVIKNTGLASAIQLLMSSE